ncbi:hypothetical protein [Lysinibacillus xylanilyticus]|uniref:hypothetical protein n=1 Tax=Lysinibacillus xylanilyticus TaxID=582475 RepID=UPI0037F78ABA
MEIKTFNLYETVFDSKRFSTHEKKLFFIGIVSDFILSKDIFPKNSELRVYAEPYFQFNNTELREYLLESRTTLVARITKIILTTSDFDSCYMLFEYHKNYLIENCSPSTNASENITPHKEVNILDELLKVRLKK